MVLSDIAQKAFSGFSSSSSTATAATTTTTTTSTSFWATAPDGLTLEMVLADQAPEPFSRKDFVHYLKISYCNENLLFYEAVTEYKDKCAAYFGLNAKETKPTSVLLSDGITQFDFTSTNANVLSPREKLWFETLKHKFEQILQDFVLSDAPQEINIPYEVRHQLLESYQTRQLYHPALLYPACSAVIELLRISAFIPFATDPNRLYCPIKTNKKLSFKKQKSAANLVSPPQSPPPPSPPLPESTSTGLLKRFTTSLKIRYNNQDTSGPVSPPTPRLSNWRQINIPDLSPFKSSSTPPTKQSPLPPLPPPKQSNNTTEKSFTMITPPPSTLAHNQSSISTISRRNSSSSSISSSSNDNNNNII